MKAVVQGVVLAAGEGQRLRPVTASVPKPLVPFFGRPLIDWALDKLVRAGCRRIAVNAFHCAALVEAHVRRLGSRMDVEFHVVREPMLLGTGGAVRNLGYWLDDQPFYVLNADAVLGADPRELSTDGELRPALLVTKDLRWRDQRRIVSDSDRHFAGLDEAGREDGFTFCGLTLADSDLPRRLPDGPSCLLRQGYVPYLSEIPVRLVETTSFFADTGTPETLADAHRRGLDWVRSLPRPPLSTD